MPLARLWRALFRQGSLRLWAIILGAPPLCGMAVWQIYLIRYGWPEDRAQQQLSILGYALFGTLVIVAIIVIALATVKVRATIPGGTLDVGSGDDDDDDERVGWPPRRASRSASAPGDRGRDD